MTIPLNARLVKSGVTLGLASLLWAGIAQGTHDRRLHQGHLTIEDYNAHINLNGWDFPKLKKVVEGKKSLDSLLNALNSTGEFEEAFNNPTFIYDSASENAEHVSLLKPRVVLAKDKLLLAFDSSAQTLQVLEAHLETVSYRSHEIRFDGGSPEVLSDQDSCAHCHGTPLRPLWPTYPMWVGIYGFQSEQAWLAYESFRSDPSKPSLYRKVFEKALSHPVGDPSAKLAPLRLSVHMTLFSSQFAKRTLSTHPLWEQHRFAVAGALERCEVEKFFPQAGKSEHALSELTYRFNESFEQVRADLKVRHARLFSDTIDGIDFDSQEVSKYARVAYVLERLGLTLEDWAFRPFPGSPPAPLFANGSGGFSDFRKWGLNDLLTDTRLLSCEQLKRRSLEQFDRSKGFR